MQFNIRSSLALVAAFVVGTACSKSAGDSASKESVVAVASVTLSGAAHEIEVTGLDYAFNMPDSLDAGRTAFKFTNKGKVFHEYNIVLLKTDATLGQFIDAMNKDVTVKPFIDGAVGVLFASPGKTSSGFLTADLLPGRTYAIQCIFKDSAATKSHREMGMFKAVVVRNNVAPTIPALKTDTIVGTDYAYTKYPRTLTPGWHHFVFVNEGKHRHEISLGMLKEGVTVPAAVESMKNNGDFDALFDADFGVLHSPAGTSPLGTLDFEVLPGREYVIMCTFQDDPKALPHIALGMVTSMVASK